MTYNRLSSYATTVSYNRYTGMQQVTYHTTNIVQWNMSTIILDSAGYQTVTTKKKMNQAARQFDLDFTVYQEDFVWYVTTNLKHSYDEGITWIKPYEGQNILYKDGMILQR